MLPYYLLVIVAFFFTIFDFVRSEYVRLLAYVSLCALLIGFVGLRAVGVDNDGTAYEDAFNLASSMSWSDLLTGNYPETMERGYLLLNKVVNTLGGNIQAVFLLMAVITGAVNYTLIFRKSPMPFLSVLIYVGFFYFYRDFTQIRFALAAGLGIWALFQFIERKYIGFFLLVFVAVFFHAAALVILLPAFVVSLFFRSPWFFLFLPVLGLIGGLFSPVMLLFQLGGLPPVLVNYVQADEIGQGGYMISAVAQVLLVALLIFRKKLLAAYPERLLDVCYIALSLSSFINLLFISFAIMQRLSLLLFGVTVFILPYLCDILERRRSDQYIALSIRGLFMLFLLYYGLNMIGPELMQPYAIWLMP